MATHSVTVRKKSNHAITRNISASSLKTFERRGWELADPSQQVPGKQSGLKARLATPIGKFAYGYPENDESHYAHEHPYPLDADWNVLKDQTHKCIHCGKEFKMDGLSTRYDTPSGHLEPGCLYWEESGTGKYYWDNFEGKVLMAITPGGHHWCIDSRASNCGSPNDRLHRCWVRKYTYLTAEGTDITVGKDGHTCKAGAGSIAIGNGKEHWHGFLDNGYFTLNRGR